MPRYDEKGRELDVWGNRRCEFGWMVWGERRVPDLDRPRPCVLRGCTIQRDWCERKQPLSTALALGVLATRIRARHGSFEEARAAWALEGADPQAAALAEMRQLMERDHVLMWLLRPRLRWPPLRL